MCYLMAQTWRILSYNINIGVILVKIWVFDPQGAHIYGCLQFFAINIKDIASRFNLIYFFVVTIGY